ncbi:MAG: hypothetical protein IKD42_05840 [Kiritimatiellae bacterium]|nr:hypothetical protein [Kiritimatiellia bacterium]
MKCVHTSVVQPAHKWTKSPSPWLIDSEFEKNAKLSEKGRKFGWKLFHYLSGGGMRVFGRTVEQEETDIKLNRFFAVMGTLAAIWLALLVL